ncbi:hypothetical protein LOC68_22690 [Blastopirellula sp. JC732]|uniref:Uncharacterized protein n=1 Tax=Blastopirellula sediminis TaxID=2894196 RepID=A0A9X1SHG9_9BACT|nr:hypothetical protein [Blastopirellula sediminis]MCC9605490.1 hypothetical protein [Blastopirellula sediminis]MCC9631210.1 hypothetical protein [Blastopirellula sediminis]
MQESGERPPISLRSRRWALLVVLTVLFLGFDYLMTGLWRLSEGREMAFPQGAYVGLFVLQIDLIAFWTAFGLGRIVVRLPWALLAITLTYIAHQKGASRFIPYEVPPSEQLVLAGILLFGWLAATLSLLGYRLVTRRRLTLSDQATDSSRKFHLQHLILGTALFGVTFAMLNWFGYPVPDVFHFEGQLLFALSVAAVVNLVTVIPAIACAFRLWESWPARHLILAVICLTLTVVEIIVLCAVLGMPPDFARAFAFLALINFVQGFGLFWTLSWFRLAGYDLRVVDGVLKSETEVESPPPIDADPWTQDD